MAARHLMFANCSDRIKFIRTKHNANTMRTVVSEEVDVVAVFRKGSAKRRRSVMPRKVIWHNKEYLTLEVGVWNPQRKGREFHHFITASTATLCFYLDFNAETLQWTLMETSDGMAE